MGWLQTTGAKAKTAFFEGTTLITHLAQSSYGKFMNVIGAAKLDNDTFKLPRIVVVGVQSSGKSSLLESITKCPIFPRDRELATRSPVRLCLQNSTNKEESVTVAFRGTTKSLKSKNELLDFLKNVFDSLQDAQGNPIITEDEVTITLKAPNIPTFELIDLPGIREFPVNLRQVTHNIASNYTRDPNTMVLCVVEASLNSITSSQAMGYVIQNRKQENTILALTMVDKVPEEDIEDNVVKRITGRSEEIKTLGLAGCVAVINRTHQDKVTLAQAEAKEAEYFKRLLSNMPEGSPYTAEEISENVSVGKLVPKLDKMFHKFIRRDWSPRAVAQMKARQAEAERELKTLGTPVDKVNSEEVITAMLRVAHENMMRGLDAAFLHQKLQAAYNEFRCDMIQNTSESDTAYRVLKTLAKYTGDATGSPLLGDLQEMFSRESCGFLKQFSNDQTLMLMRFEELINTIKTNLAKALEAHSEELMKLFSDAAHETVLRDGQYQLRYAAESGINRVFRYMRWLIAQELLVDKTTSTAYKTFQANRAAYMTESKAWQANRATKENLLKEIIKSIEVINNIDSYMQDPKSKKQ